MADVPGASASNPPDPPDSPNAWQRTSDAFGSWRQSRRDTAQKDRAREHRVKAAECAREFEDVLVEEYTALLPDARDPGTSYAIDDDEIVDLARMAEYLYEGWVKTTYSSYRLNIGADAARCALRARIWETLPASLQSQLERIVMDTHRGQIIDEPGARRELSQALNRIIAGEELAGESPR
jgi:hypothetical protein